MTDLFKEPGGIRAPRGLSGLKGLEGKGFDSLDLPAPEEIVSTPKQPGRREDPLEKAALQDVPGSLPERIVWKWLERKGHLYEAQMPQFGGRVLAGGAVVDFIVYDLAGMPVVIRVQGDYWHGPMRPGQQSRDDDQSARLRLQGYLVVDLWEGDIYEAVQHDRLSQYIEGALLG